MSATSRSGALVLGFISLTPILFWRVLSDKVIYYKAFDTFYVICLVMLVFIVFETVFGWLRQFLVLFLTSRVDAKILDLRLRQSDELADGFL